MGWNHREDGGFEGAGTYRIEWQYGEMCIIEVKYLCVVLWSEEVMMVDAQRSKGMVKTIAF